MMRSVTIEDLDRQWIRGGDIVSVALEHRQLSPREKRVWLVMIWLRTHADPFVINCKSNADKAEELFITFRDAGKEPV